MVTPVLENGHTNFVYLCLSAFELGARMTQKTDGRTGNACHVTAAEQSNMIHVTTNTAVITNKLQTTRTKFK